MKQRKEGRKQGKVRGRKKDKEIETDRRTSIYDQKKTNVKEDSTASDT